MDQQMAAKLSHESKELTFIKSVGMRYSFAPVFSIQTTLSPLKFDQSQSLFYSPVYAYVSGQWPI